MQLPTRSAADQAVMTIQTGSKELTPVVTDMPVIRAVSGRDNAGRFVAGASGNPHGRPVAEHEVRQLARQHGPDAVRRLVQLMQSTDGRVAHAAAVAILDRGYGRCPQALTGPDGEALPAPTLADFYRTILVVAPEGDDSELNDDGDDITEPVNTMALSAPAPAAPPEPAPAPAGNAWMRLGTET